MEPQTAELARVAGPGAVSGERFGYELRLALAEDDPCLVFERVAELNALALPEGFVPRPGGLADALALLPGDGRRDLLVLAACCAGMELELLVRWLDHLQWNADDRDVVAASSRWVTGAPLRGASGPAAIARAARGAPIEAVALAGGENARRWIEELRAVRLEIGRRRSDRARVCPKGRISGRGCSARWTPSSRAGRAGATPNWPSRSATAIRVGPR